MISASFEDFAPYQPTGLIQVHSWVIDFYIIDHWAYCTCKYSTFGTEIVS